ncbi:hypothetical protein TREMEDRAFT_30206 [Tremella mesenterica DSM 1558]|uniref:uncharacterized protein n=1 Tax=Tremella mesenterica (strain ATCC 24925 / CBS 8224 / DSM 1558 / NBRC 9311 / NRRL Y-6157 / RJB 2259-6 / UBC 559-6) TaxID=578456 RepID=UPI0003F4A38A|nr:uncharacterized protein TREMEDRAFT_30206 [Tremella mesenterica DSM 1558]EIW70236.1 hypothetical protein TREMEDRAFT_30206 [Tremella mesenterica DSM 1558]
MWSLPTFIAFPFTLPSLPSISLPANIQRRFLSFILKRTLGRFIKAGLDVDQIQAQIGEGKIEIESLELDHEEINSLIPTSVPLRVTSGTLAKVAAQLPFPNLWSSSLSLSLDTLHLDLTLTQSSSHNGTPLSNLSPNYQTSPPDLTSSVTTAAGDFLHDELNAFEEAELDRSIRQSIILSHTDPFITDDDVPGAFPPTSYSEPGHAPDVLAPTVESTTVLAGLVERILERLELKVKDVRIRVKHEDEQHGITFELRIGQITYGDESTPTGTGPTGAREILRVVRFSNVEIYSSPERPVRKTHAASSRSSSMSNFSSSDSSNTPMTKDEEAMFFMSQSVADLRQSSAMSMASGMSVYHSTYDGGEEDEAESSSTTRERSPSPVPSSVERSNSREISLLNFGNEDIVCSMKTITPLQTASSNNAQKPSMPNTPEPCVALEVSMGTISVLLLPAQVAAMLSAVRYIQPDAVPSDPPPNVPSSSIQPRLTARQSIKDIHVVLVYDIKFEVEDAFQTAVSQFFQRPASHVLPYGHLRLRVESLQAIYSWSQVSPSQSTHGGSSGRRPSQMPTSPPAEISLSIGEVSIFEHIPTATRPMTNSTADLPPGGTYPVLIFDPNLSKQYLMAPGIVSPATTPAKPMGPVGQPFPEFECGDWRGIAPRGGPNEKAWRVRLPGRSVLKTHHTETERFSPCITVRRSISQSVFVSLAPVHLFCDLSLVERMLPFLRLVSPAMRSPSSRSLPPSPIAFRSTRPLPDGRPDPTFPEHLQSTSGMHYRRTERSVQTLQVSCPMIRVDIRCPAPPNRRGSWGDGGYLRSGVVSLDIHTFCLKTTYPRQSSQSRDFRSASGTPSIRVEWRKVLLFFCRVPAKKASAFLVIGPLAPDVTDTPDDPILFPSIVVEKGAATKNLGAQSSTQVVTIDVPSLQANVRQSTVEGLQFFADDITHWLDGAFGDGSSPRPRDDLKMIGSRFFGSKASSSASSSTYDDDDSTAATILRLSVSETDIRLLVPRIDPTGNERALSIKASDTNAKVEKNTSGKQEIVFSITIMDAEFSDVSRIPSMCIWSRTTPLTLTLNNRPIVQMRFSSLTNPVTTTKETGIRIVTSSWTFFLTKDFAWIQELRNFVKTPEGVFEDVVPSEVTRVELSLHESSIHIAAPTLPGALVAVLGQVEVHTVMVSDSNENTIHIDVPQAHLLAIDDLSTMTTLQSGFTTSTETWHRAGMAQLCDLTSFSSQLIRDLINKETQFDISRSRLSLTICADSMATLVALIGDLSNLSAFVTGKNTDPDLALDIDMIMDDLPTNLDYLDRASRQTSQLPERQTGETLRTWQVEDNTNDPSSQTIGETIKILYKGPLDMPVDYWENLPSIDITSNESRGVGQFRIRIKKSDVTIRIHDGYDWSRTRKIIEDEIKAVRKRLEKIRQLLASGQTADASIEKTNSVLFNSVYIGLDQNEELDSEALIAAIDAELLDLADPMMDTATQYTQSSWQTLPPRGTLQNNVGEISNKRSKSRKKFKKLSRSKKPQIEVILQAVNVDMDTYDDGEMVNRLHVGIGKMEILDHIKTSTWKKFLTEMKGDSRGNMRESGADMVRLELMSIRTGINQHKDQEARLRIKVLPLRLHIDQDALDFLKKFGSFKLPAEGPPAKSVSEEPFFQFVEIFPIELKVDYKPKRVDFKALREGKTAELMNFFHFDAAEMTLRHLSLTGIPGWARLSDTLQDIWTPDVKANQLADVVSGIAPIRSLVNVGSGVADLILLPIEQYRKDGRIARGVQRGAGSFVRSTGMEMMRLGARMATGTQVILEKAEGVLGGKFSERITGEITRGSRDNLGDDWVGEDNSSDEEEEGKRKRVRSRFADQPIDMREGVQAAYKSLSRNINSAAQTILAVPMEVYERSADDGPLRAVIRAVPIAVLKPMIGASEAVSKTLLGMRNSLDPHARKELGDKYK